MTPTRRSLYSLGLALGLLFPGGTGDAQETARPVTLEEALRLFAERNPELQIIRAEAAAARGRARQAGAFPNPAILATHETLDRGAASYSETYYNLSQRIVWPWKLSARSGAAEATARALEAAVRADSLRLAFEVKRVYLEAIVADERSAAIDEAIRVVRQVERSGRARFARGDISGYELRRLGLARARYESALASAMFAVGESRRALAAQILPEHAAARAVDTLAGPPPEVTVSGPTGAWDRRPERAAAEAQRIAALQSLSAARRERFPDLTLTAGYKTQSDEFDGIFLGGSLPLPIFDRNRGAIAAAAADSRAAAARLTRARLRVERDIRAAADRYRSIRSHYDLVAGRLLSEATELLEIARAAYAEGEMSLLELLDATDAYRDARVRRAELLSDYWTAYYDLERALGGWAVTDDSRQLEEAEPGGENDR